MYKTGANKAWRVLKEMNIEKIFRKIYIWESREMFWALKSEQIATDILQP